MSQTKRWVRRPEGSNWGEFGPDDQLGRLNLLTKAKILQGVEEVREGLTFCLSLPLDIGYWLNPSRQGPVLRPVSMSGDMPMMNYPLSRLNPSYVDVTCDDSVQLDLQYSTQWDALGHVGSLFDADGDGVEEIVYYNGFRAHEHVHGPFDYRPDRVALPTGEQNPRLDRLGIEHMARAGVQGRGVMIDLHAHFGIAPHPVGYDDLMRVLEADAVSVEAGDMVCLRTGLDRLMLDGAAGAIALPATPPCPGLNGRDQRLLNWITDSGVAALISDQAAVEIYPPQPASGARVEFLPLHQHCLFKIGVPLGELWHLSPLADWLRAHRRSRFLLTAPPLYLPGAAGSPATPIATV